MTSPRAAALALVGVATLFLLGVVVTPLWPQVAVARGVAEAQDAQGVAEDQDAWGVAEAQDAAPSGRRLLSGRRLFYSREYLPSLYLNYQNPSSQETTSWFSGLDVTESTKATFFAVQRTQFGYLGIQQTLSWAGQLFNFFGMRNMNGMMMSDPYFGLVIFSAWNIDAGNCQVESVGDGAYQDMFTGEGTGCQIKLDTAWGMEHNGFVTTAARTNGRILLSGYWHPGDESWRLVGSISVPDDGQQFGKGGIAAFLEQYYSSTDQNDLRMANFGPQYVETSTGSWVPVETATFATTDSSRQAYYVGAVTPDGEQFTMGLAGMNVPSISSNTPDGAVLRLSATEPSSSNEELQSWIALRDTNALPQGCGGRVTTCGSNDASLRAIFGRPSLLPDSLGSAVFALLLVALIVTAAATLCMCFRS